MSYLPHHHRVQNQHDSYSQSDGSYNNNNSGYNSQADATKYYSTIDASSRSFSTRDRDRDRGGSSSRGTTTRGGSASGGASVSSRRSYYSGTGSIGSYQQTASYTQHSHSRASQDQTASYSYPRTTTPSVALSKQQQRQQHYSHNHDNYSTCGSEATTIVNGGWGRCPYQIEFGVQNVAKQVAATKRVIHFRFGFANAEALASGRGGVECRGDEHDVMITWSITGGKRSICVDGREVQYTAGKRANAARRADILEAAFGMPGDHVCQILCYAYKPAAGSPEKRDKRWRQYNLIIDGRSFFDLPQVFDLGAKGFMQTPIREEILPPSYIDSSDWEDTSRNTAPAPNEPDEFLVKNHIQAQIAEQRRLLEARRKAAKKTMQSNRPYSESTNSDTSNLINLTDSMSIRDELSKPQLTNNQENRHSAMDSNGHDSNNESIPDVNVFSTAPSELDEARARQNNIQRLQGQYPQLSQEQQQQQRYPAIPQGQDPRQLPRIKMSGDNQQLSSPLVGFPSQQHVEVTVIPQGSQLRPNDRAMVSKGALLPKNNQAMVQQRSQMPESGAGAMVQHRSQMQANNNQAMVAQRPQVQSGNNQAMVPQRAQMMPAGGNGAMVPQMPQMQSSNNQAVVPQRAQMSGGSQAMVAQRPQMQGGNNHAMVPRTPQAPEMQGNNQALVPQRGQAMVPQRNHTHPSSGAMVPQRSGHQMQQQGHLVPVGGVLNPQQPPTYDQITSGMGTYGGGVGK